MIGCSGLISNTLLERMNSKLETSASSASLDGSHASNLLSTPAAAADAPSAPQSGLGSSGLQPERIRHTGTSGQARVMPNRRQLEAWGREDLAAAIQRHGGFKHFAAQLGVPYQPSPRKPVRQHLQHE